MAWPHQLKKNIDILEDKVIALCTSRGTTFETREMRKQRCVRRQVQSAESAAGIANSSNRPLNDHETLQRVVDELMVEVDAPDVDIDFVKTKMSLIGELFDDLLVEGLRSIMIRNTGTAAEERSRVTRSSIVAAMDKALSLDFNLADYLKKPEQPKGLARSIHIENLKMGKKFADYFVDAIAAMNIADIKKINMLRADAAMVTIEKWADKYQKDGEFLDRNIHVTKIVPFEIIKRILEREFPYFYCPLCNALEFTVKQHLAHHSNGVHCKHMKRISELPDQDGWMKLGYFFATKYFVHLSDVSENIHNFYSHQVTTPYVVSGSVVANPMSNTIPTVEWLALIENKYAMQINGEIDSTRLRDTSYMAEIIPGIIARHKSKIGKDLFAEIDAYFKKGKDIFCHRCHVTVSSSVFFYRHLRNPYHLGCNDGRHFHLITVSVNLHTQEPLIC
ncbi:hypothetical protein PRIPAC_96976 [Pristionchus pacificus]|uniref:C2H2-type domain-containing protein n=1 Tax=Pristionchus pacificus TaxID=54126 RepID=A0A2A6CUG3_PRIPA|nr:hypothetical protein PRIPAC_96976 [Pristionchus pacificus]|eukprot:PDM81758.1 hypothetical protein PRIPAC_37600 [Pristionchus pacificus]